MPGTFTLLLPEYLVADPRVTAMLVCLRYCCRTKYMLQHAAGEDPQTAQHILDAMEAARLIRRLGEDWYLDRHGVAWIERWGLSINEMSKIWVVEAAVARQGIEP